MKITHVYYKVDEGGRFQEESILQPQGDSCLLGPVDPVGKTSIPRSWIMEFSVQDRFARQLKEALDEKGGVFFRIKLDWSILWKIKERAGYEVEGNTIKLIMPDEWIEDEYGPIPPIRDAW